MTTSGVLKEDIKFQKCWDNFERRERLWHHLKAATTYCLPERKGREGEKESCILGLKPFQFRKHAFIEKRREEDLNYTSVNIENRWCSCCHNLQTRQTKQLQSCFQGVFVFFSSEPFHPSLSSSSFLICCTPKATEELGGAALQEGSTGPQRKSLALLLNSPVSAALSCVSGYRLLPPASRCDFSVVEKHDSVFSESPGAISRQCRRRQCLRNSNSLEYRGRRLKREKGFRLDFFILKTW